MKQILLMILFVLPTVLYAAHWKAKVVDAETNQPIQGAVVLCMKNDSTALAHSLTDSEGHFLLEISDADVSMAKVMVQHVAYETFCCTYSEDTEQIKLSLKTNVMDEVSVVATRKVVSMSGNALVYNPSAFIERYAPTSAMELISHLPGVIGNGQNVQLLGINRLMLVIDGKPVSDPTLVAEQLRTLPSNKVRSVEISYNAPAEYHFSGAVINVKTTFGYSTENSAFLQSGISHARYLSTEERVSHIWSTPKFSSFTTLGYSYNHTKGTKETIQYSDASFTNPHRSRNERTENKDNRFHASADLTFKPSEHTKIAIDYYGIFSKGNADISADISQGKQYKSLSHEVTKEQVHTTGISASLPKQWTLGARYKHYDSPFTQKYQMEESSSTPITLPNDYIQESHQFVDHIRLTIDKMWQISQMASISVGTSYQYNHTNTKVDNHSEGISSLHSHQNEDNMGTYIQSDFTLFKRLNVSFTLNGEYIHAQYKDLMIGKNNTLWNKMDFLPSFTLGMPTKKGNFLQLAMNSQKNYPSFWALNPQTTIIDDHTLSTGNNELQPSVIYDGNLMYLFRQKWYFILGCTYMPDYFANIPHQDKASGMTIYRYENYDYSLFNNLSVMRMLNFKHYNGRVGVHILRMEDKKKDFYGESFDNHKWVWSLSTNNSYTIPFNETKRLILGADFRFQSSAIQGIYKLSETYMLNASIRMIWNSRLTTTIEGTDLLSRATPRKFSVDITTQECNIYNRFPQKINFTVTLKLGKDKKFEDNNIDVSRFGRK